MNYMFKIITITTVLLFFQSVVIAQDTIPSGKPIAIIYSDYRQQLNGDGSFAGFGVSRAFIGYSYKIDNHLSARILLDIGDPLRNEEVSSKRYSYLRNALIAYRMEKLTLTFGITDGRGHKEPLVFWNKRYLARTFLLNFKYMEVADIGLIADYKISPMVSIDAQVMNGEGFTNIQNDNSLLYGAGITVRPENGLIFRFFCDTYSRVDATKNTFASFAGYTSSRFSLGFEFNYKTDFDWIDSHNVYGFSAMGAINLTPDIELFGRYDRSSSVIPGSEQEPWNFEKDGSLIITGIQYTLSKHLRFAVDYQGWTPWSESTPRWDYLQLNAEFVF